MENKENISGQGRNTWGVRGLSNVTEDTRGELGTHPRSVTIDDKVYLRSEKTLLVIKEREKIREGTPG